MYWKLTSTQHSEASLHNSYSNAVSALRQQLSNALEGEWLNVKRILQLTQSEQPTFWFVERLGDHEHAPMRIVEVSVLIPSHKKMGYRIAGSLYLYV